MQFISVRWSRYGTGSKEVALVPLKAGIGQMQTFSLSS